MYLVTLDSDGRLVEQNVTVGAGDATIDYDAKNTSGATITARSAVHFKDVGGTGVLEFELADTSATGKQVDGFLVADCLDGATGKVRVSGPMNGFTSLYISKRYFSDSATPGNIVTYTTNTANELSQEVGKAVSDIILNIQILAPIKRA